MEVSMVAMQYHIMVWKICGFWDLPGQPRWYSLYSTLIYIIFYCFFPLCIAIQIMFAISFDEKIDILLILPTACAGIKGSFVLLKRRQLRQLFALCSSMDELHVRTDEHRAVIKEQVRGSVVLVRVLSIIYYSTIVAIFMVAMLSEERRFMWESYYPFDYEQYLVVYYCLLLFQLVATFLVAFINSSCDLYGPALYMLLGAHIDILTQRFGNLGKDGSEEVDQREIAACAEYHNICIVYSKSMNDILSNHFLFQFVTSGLVLCGSDFKITTLNPMDDFTDFLLTFMYIVSMTYQIYIPCYYGSIVKAKSEHLPNGMFEANWLDNTREFRSSITIFGERAKRAIDPIAGKLFAVGLPTFVSIMKSAYSLMAFLKNIESRQ